MKLLLRVLFLSERCLCDDVFVSVLGSVVDLCFNELGKGLMM